MLYKVRYYKNTKVSFFLIKIHNNKVFMTPFNSKHFSQEINRSTSQRIALKILKKGHVDIKDLNKLLSFIGTKLTQNQLDEMLKIPRLVFTNLSRDTIKNDRFLQNIGKYRGKIQIPGVYI